MKERNSAIRQDNNRKKLLLPTTIYNEATRRLEELRIIRMEKEKALKKAPPEKIHIIKSGNRVQYYLRKDKSDIGGKYIPKSEVEKIRKFVQKSYDEKVLKQVSREIQCLEKCLDKSEQFIENLRKIYSDNPNEIKELINPIDISDEDYKSSWIIEEYEGKEIPGQTPVYLTKKKERVRSKSELNIANTLEDMGIPYKYEYPLTLTNGRRVYPDFTILNVKKRKVYYWEHRGMMDDPEYARHSVFKLKSYMKNGIVVGKNLIITEETSLNPLGTDEIDTIIQKFLM